MKTKQSITIYLSLFIGVTILINIIADRFFFRLDFTADKRYTLSTATKNILDSLKGTVTVTAYFSEDVPAQIAQIRRDFKEQLVEYSSRSKGKIMFEFINPNKDQQNEQKAQSEGIRPVQVNMQEKDQVTVKRIYIGAVIQYGENKKEVIPVINPGAAMEYALTTAIKKVSTTNKPFIGIIQGNGEASLQAMHQVIQSLSVLYNVEPVNIKDSVNLSKYKTLAMIASKDTIHPVVFKKLDEYLALGRNLFIAYNSVNVDLQTLNAKPSTIGLDNWLEKKGIKVEKNLVLDERCAQVMVSQRQGNFTIQTPMPFPYAPVITNFADHPITKGLESVMLQFPSSVSYKGNAVNTFTALVKTSDHSGIEQVPSRLSLGNQEKALMQPSQTIGGLLSGKINDDKTSNIVLITAGEFPVNGEGQNVKQLPDDNVNLIVNAIDWLSDDTGLIDLRTKEVTARIIEQTGDGKRLFLKYFNFLFPVILIIGFGLFRMQYRKNQRLRRMAETI